jgi:nucleotide-binding universal stress UspA family protein
MLTIGRILCPIDFSETSMHAVDLATHVAGWYESRITGLHAVTPLVAPYPGLAAVDPRTDLPTQEAERRRLCGAVSQAFGAARDAGIAVDVLVNVGQPAREILDCAATLPAHLIVMGTHGLSGFEHLLLGSVAEKVLRKATCPVLTVPPRVRATPAPPFKRVLCAVDFSPSSLHGFEFALSLAEEADAALTIAHILEWPWEEPPAPAFETLPLEQAFSLAAYRREREADAAARLAALIPEEARNWCTPGTQIRHGKPYIQILELAAEEQADLIVIGVRGRSAIDMAVFGSTTAQVVRRATCPVLTVVT